MEPHESCNIRKLWRNLADQRESLLADQDQIFQSVIDRNEKLEEEVAELRRDLYVWKKAYAECVAASEQSVEEMTMLKARVSHLDCLKDQSPIVLGLIDGDGNIFRKELLELGLQGGRLAAQLLTDRILGYQQRQDQSGGRFQLWVYIFLNMKGLQQTLVASNVCNQDAFEAFVTGFNQANPRFTINDVHAGKEAADVKIKEYLLSYARFTHTSKIFFGGGHDNGYLHTLTELQSERLLDKIVLLKGYKRVAAELQTLLLPTLEIESLFMPEKLSVAKWSNGCNQHASPAWTVKESPAALSYSKVASSGVEYFGKQSNISISTPAGLRRPNPHLELHKNVPPPCNLFYLAQYCINGDNCQYAHDYILSPEQYDMLRVNAKKAPCPAVKKDLPCALGDNCPLGHKCPSGPECLYFSRGKCFFKGATMHVFD
ncbi:hypothetical protein JB92DRAFT_878273 [Gautieria morchelliformis]|nr:hypothetical protein JB92DRAFT_878273 [Gautieria morchelliformis]